jgi:predicted nucleotidyltransferase
MSLAMNRVLEIRLLKTSKGSTDAQLDIAGTIEKMRKQNEKLKESLSTRRKDRINPHEHKGFSIIDLAVAFEEDKKKKLKDKIKTHKLEEDIILKEYNKFEGNRYDLDVELEEGGDPS